MVNADSAGQQDVQSNGQRKDKSPLFSPRFRSAAAMAGWDEETLASLIVEDTPDRERRAQKKRSDNASDLKTPPTNSRRKRRAHRRSPNYLPVAVLDLEDAASVEPPKEPEPEPELKKNTPELEKESCEKETAVVSTSNSAAIPCMDRLREELSCAICLEICFEPSTTPCGHSFCKKCLRSAADKCGKKCPKCRQLMSNGRSCTINTILWNTIQLLFPQEVEARKAAASSSKDKQVQKKTSPVQSRTVLELGSGGERAETGRLQELRRIHNGLRRNSVRPSRGLRTPSQDEDAALALRLQREEYMMHRRGSSGQEYSSSLILARANLRAMASRASRRG